MAEVEELIPHVEPIARVIDNDTGETKMMYELTFDPGQYSRESITQAIRNLLDSYLEQGIDGEFKTSIKFATDEWRSNIGGFLSFEDEVSLYVPNEDKDYDKDIVEEPDFFTQFRIYPIKN